MERTTIRGNQALADNLGVHRKTVENWKKKGLLAPATLVNVGRVTIYDLEEVYKCLHHSPVKRGRRAAV